MASSLAITTLLTYLKTGKDLRRDAKTLLKHLIEVLLEYQEETWSKQVNSYLLDTLLSEVLVKLEGNSQYERESLNILHTICSRALLPVNSKPFLVRPMFLHEKEKSSTSNLANIDPLAENWFKNLESEIMNKNDNVFRRILALKTAGALAETGKLQGSLKKRLGEICREVLLNESMLVRVSAPLVPENHNSSLWRIQKRSSKNSQSGGLTKENEPSFLALTEACLLCARQTLPEGGSPLFENIEIAVGLGSKREEVCRLTMSFFLSVAQLFDVDIVLREFQVRLPVVAGTIELTDTLAACDFAKIMLMITSSPKDKSFLALALLVRDERPAVFLQTCELLAQLPWSWLNDYTLPARPSDSEKKLGGSKLIPEIAYQMTQTLATKRSTLLFATCNAIALLGRARNDWIAEDTQNRKFNDDPFFVLSGKVAKLCLDCTNETIRAQAAVALAWIGKASSSGGFLEKLRAIKGIENESYLVVEALIERTKRNPQRENVESTLAILWHYRNSISADLGHRALVTCLMFSRRDSTFSPQQRIDGKFQENLALKYALSLLDWANDSQTTHWEVSILSLLACEWPFIDTTFKNKNSVFLRLERSLRFSSHWIVRREAATGLVKLGVISKEPIRIKIFEALGDFFQASYHHSFERDQDIRGEIVGPALQMFDNLYELQSKNSSDPIQYETLTKLANSLCSGLPPGFSFLNQLKELTDTGIRRSNIVERSYEDKDQQQFVF